MTTPLGRLYAAVPTPVQQNLSIDVERLAAHCLEMMNAGADGLILFGTTGEGTFFSVAEKTAATRALQSLGVPIQKVVLSPGVCALADAAQLLRVGDALGCPAGLVLPPFFPKPVADDDLFAWYAALIKAAAPAKFLLYHIPAIAGVGFSPELASRLFDQFPETVIGVKDSTPDSSLAKALVPRGATGIYVSTEADLRNYVSSGGAGVISASLNVSMPLAKAVLVNAAGSNADRLSATRRLLTQYPLIAAIKTVLAHRYGAMEWKRVTPPQRALTQAEEKQLLYALETIERD